MLLEVSQVSPRNAPIFVKGGELPTLSDDNSQAILK
jgi:hypothetical protein